MFKKESAPVSGAPTASSAIETIIGVNTKFEGNISSTAVIRVDGTVTGNISSNALVIVGPSGSVRGNVETTQIYIAGKVEGNLLISEKAEIVSGGDLLGDVLTGDLVMEEGAVFEGKLTTRKKHPNSSEPIQIPANV